MLLNPLVAVRKYCLWCCANQPTEVKFCCGLRCPVYHIRQGRNSKHVRSVLSAIRRQCIDCTGITDVKNCRFDGKKEILCDLYTYRMGKNPALKGKRRGFPKCNTAWKSSHGGAK